VPRAAPPTGHSTQLTRAARRAHLELPRARDGALVAHRAAREPRAQLEHLGLELGGAPAVVGAVIGVGARLVKLAPQPQRAAARVGELRERSRRLGRRRLRLAPRAARDARRRLGRGLGAVGAVRLRGERVDEPLRLSLQRELAAASSAGMQTEAEAAGRSGSSARSRGAQRVARCPGDPAARARSAVRTHALGHLASQ
jgi:hypothetical protein